MKRFNQELLTLLIVFGLALSACATPKGPAAAPAPEKPGVAAPAASQAQLTREQQLIEGAKKEGSVVFWVYALEDGSAAIKSFKEKYPFLEVKVSDINGAEMMVRLLEEAKAGRYSVDMLYIAEKHLLSTPLWKEVIAEYEWPNTESWPYQRGHNYYRAIAFPPNGITYNTSLLTAAEAPRSWEDLNSTKWRGKAILSRSTSDVPLYFAYLWGEKGKLNWDKSFSFWREVVSNVRPRVGQGHTAPMQMLVAGESALFIMASLYVGIRYKAMGAPVEIAPTPTALATPVLLALVKNAPHPNAARLLANYLTLYESQILYGDAFLAVAHPEAAKKARMNLELASRGTRLDGIPLETNTQENLQKSVSFWVDLLR